MEAASLWVENYMNSYPNATYNSKLGIGFLIKEMYEGLAAKVANPKGTSLAFLPLLIVDCSGGSAQSPALFWP